MPWLAKPCFGGMLSPKISQLSVCHVLGCEDGWCEVEKKRDTQRETDRQTEMLRLYSKS